MSDFHRYFNKNQVTNSNGLSEYGFGDDFLEATNAVEWTQPAQAGTTYSRLATERGGIARMTSSTDNNVKQIRRALDGGWFFAQGKAFDWRARVRLSDATTHGFLIGWATGATAAVLSDGAVAPTVVANYLCLYKKEGLTALRVYCYSGSATKLDASTSLTTMANSTWYDLWMECVNIDGSYGKIVVRSNGALIYQTPDNALVDISGGIQTAQLNWYCEGRNAAASADTIDLDYAANRADR